MARGWEPLIWNRVSIPGADHATVQRSDAVGRNAAHRLALEAAVVARELSTSYPVPLTMRALP
jgi:hypothetical protein